MAKWRNVKTGAVVEVTSELSGAWVKVEESAKVEETEANKPKKKTTKKK